MKVNGGAELTGILTFLFIASVLRHYNISYDTYKYQSERMDWINVYLAVLFIVGGFKTLY